MKTVNLYARLIATIIAITSVLTFTAQDSEAMSEKPSKKTGDNTQNVFELIDQDLRAPLQNLPPQLSLITRENITEVRALINQMLKAKPTEGVTVTKKLIKTNDAEVPLYIYQPKGSDMEKPGLLWIHGGGFIMGNAENDFAAEFSKHLNATVVSVDYRLAPEHPFPAGLNDSYAALLWMREHAKELGINTNRIAVGGDSAGAGMAAGLVLRNRDEKGPRIAVQFLLYPMLDNLHDTPSGSIEDYPVWNRQTSFNAWEMYLNGTPGAKASPYASAARAKNVSGLPRTFITTGTVDLFRDEIIDYAQRLMAAGVPTQLAVFPGVYHGAQAFVPGAPVSQQMINTYMKALEEVLNEN